MLELYSAPISTCSQKVRMALAEKQLDWKDHRITFHTGEHLAPAYLKLNPNGVVPTLIQDGGVVYAESLPLRRNFYLRMGRNGFPQADVDAAIARLRQTLERMGAALEKTAWIANDQFTLANVSVMPSIVRMEDLSLAHQWKDLPRVTDWYARLRARPAFALSRYPGTRRIGADC